MSSVYIKHAQIPDLTEIMKIISQAQAMLKADGSPQWQNNTDPYATIHRIAINPDYAGQHLGKIFISNLISYSYQNGIRNFRIDTHQLNKRMQALAKSSGYVHRGKIYVSEPAVNHEDNARLAFELNL
ncbi:GNAT family N-acetyltransferase [Companilactobacillus pabuli]|uniref:GNAT family N-acetyltransferase n=1 Tax=Companilactobacillus pabuli TaxID=2714036 RepID=UPI0035116B29